jgi:hypothetical protein
MSNTSVKYDDLKIALEFVSSQRPYINSAFLCRSTGQIYYCSRLGDTDELPEDIDDASLYVSIPHKNELNLGKQLALNFASEYLPELFEHVAHIFSSRGAYSRFKNLLQSQGLLEDWYSFENQQIEEKLRVWCSEEDIDLSP